MAKLEVNDRRLHDLVAPEAVAERIATGFTFTEGPVWRGDSLVFSDIPNNRIVRWRRLPEGPEVTTLSTGRSNGLTLDREGRVIAAEHGGRCVSRVAEDGSRTVLADRYRGGRLNSPNDIVAKSDGSLWFTDPPYAVNNALPGITRVPNWWKETIPGKEQPCSGVYRLTQAGAPELLTDECALPNGLAFSPDEAVLYVDDSAYGLIRAFDVRADGTLARGRVLFEMKSGDPGVADGLKVDVRGNVFCTGPGGVWVCAADGTYLGRIVLPEVPANLAWGEDGSILFITARTSVYRLATRTHGVLPGP